MHNTNHVHPLLQLLPVDLEILVQALLRLLLVVLRRERPVVQDLREAHPCYAVGALGAAGFGGDG